MNMKIKQKILALALLILALLPSFTMICSATSVEAIGEPRYKNIAFMLAGLEIDQWGYATCEGSYAVYSKIPSKITVTLQRQSGSNWVYVDSWSQSNTDSLAHTLSEGASVKSGSYRVHVTVTVYSGSTVIESASCDSYIESY